MQPVLFFFPCIHCFLLSLGFCACFEPLSGILSSMVLLPYGTHWSSASFHKLLFISQFLLPFSYSFSTHLFMHAPPLPFSHKHVSRIMHSTWPTTSLFSLNSTGFPNKSNLETFTGFFTLIFFFMFSCQDTSSWLYFFAPLSYQIGASFPLEITCFSVSTHSTWALVTDKICK